VLVSPRTVSAFLGNGGSFLGANMLPGTILVRVVEAVDKELATSEMFATAFPKGQRVFMQRVEDWTSLLPAKNHVRFLRHTKLKLYPDYHGISGLVEMGMYAISFCEEWRMEIPSKLAIEFLPETRDIVHLALLFFKEMRQKAVRLLWTWWQKSKVK
jgi:hypothetical protein